MIKPSLIRGLFRHPRPVWDEATCKKLAQKVEKDGLGTPYKFKGYMGYCLPRLITRYNGGCVRNGEWYKGEYHPYPRLPKNYELRNLTSWGLVLVEKEKGVQWVE